MTHRTEIRFLLNGADVIVTDAPADKTLLDYLRLERRLTGSKEGCAEGDCGACTVLVGRLAGGVLKYETVNACIRFLASLDGCHVVTIEHLRGENGGLHPIQQAMVDFHGSQCGFCTPGFVMSLYALWMGNPEPTETEGYLVDHASKIFLVNDEGRFLALLDDPHDPDEFIDLLERVQTIGDNQP